MSRIGKQPVPIPDKVKVDIKETTVRVEGPKGKVEKTFAPVVSIEIADKKVRVKPLEETRFANAMYGTTRSIIAGMVKGVTAGYLKELEIQGVGFKANLKGNQLDLALGYSHPILMDHSRGHQGHRHRRHEAQGRGLRQAARRRRDRGDPQLLPARTLQGQGRAHRRRARPPQGRQDRRLDMSLHLRNMSLHLRTEDQADALNARLISSRKLQAT